MIISSSISYLFVTRACTRIQFFKRIRVHALDMGDCSFWSETKQITSMQSSAPKTIEPLHQILSSQMRVTLEHLH